MSGCKVDVMYENKFQSNALYEMIKSSVRSNLMYTVITSYTITEEDPAMYVASFVRNKNAVSMLYAAGFNYKNSKTEMLKLFTQHLMKILFYTGAIVADKMLTGPVAMGNPITQAVGKIENAIDDFCIINKKIRV